MTTRAEYHARLLKLAAFLEQLDPKRFNYRRWVGDDWKGAQDLSCGTTACALGWAATMPEFQELGLRLEQVVSPDSEGDISPLNLVSLSEAALAGVVPSRREPHNGPQVAAEAVFGVKRQSYVALFCGGELWDYDVAEPVKVLHALNPDSPAATAKKVALRIRMFVGWHSAKAEETGTAS